MNFIGNNDIFTYVKQVKIMMLQYKSLINVQNYSERKENMTTNEMKDLLFEILNEHDTLFSDVALDDTRDALIVTSIDKKKFSLIVENMDEGREVIRLWAKENPATLNIEIALIQMADAGIISEEEREKYHLETVKNEYLLKERYKTGNNL